MLFCKVFPVRNGKRGGRGGRGEDAWSIKYDKSIELWSIKCDKSIELFVHIKIRIIINSNASK